MKRTTQTKKNPLMRWLVLVFFLGLLGVGSWFYVNHQNSATKPPQTLRLTAIGDSLTQGIGYGDDHSGYLPRLRASAQSKYGVTIKTSNFGVGGLRSDEINQKLQTNKTERRQVSRADVVTITAGGNDLLQSLQANLTINNETKLKKQLDLAKSTYQKRLTALLKNVKSVNPSAEIYLFGIYNPVYVYFANADAITQAVDDWTAVNRQVANDTKRVHYVDINKPLSQGQFQSAKAQKSLVAKDRQTAADLKSPQSADDILANISGTERNQYLSSNDHFHPNKQGYQVMAQKLLAAIGKTQHWHQN